MENGNFIAATNTEELQRLKNAMDNERSQTEQLFSSVRK